MRGMIGRRHCLLLLAAAASLSATAQEPAAEPEEKTELPPLVIEGSRDPLFAPERKIERLMRNAPCLGCGDDIIGAKDNIVLRAFQSALGLADKNLLPQKVPERDPADDPGDDTLYWIQRQDAADRMNRVKGEP